MLMGLSGPSRPPVAGGKPSRLVIPLHGRGSDGEDLLDLQRFWGPVLPEVILESDMRFFYRLAMRRSPSSWCVRLADPCHREIAALPLPLVDVEWRFKRGGTPALRFR
jgi:hypothetical protein